MLGLFGVFGRSPRLRELESNLRALDLHPRLLPDGLKIAIVRRLEADADDAAIEAAAALLAVGVLGPTAFAERNGAALADATDRRILEATIAGSGVDADLLLLLLHAGLVHPEVVERHGLRAEPAD